MAGLALALRHSLVAPVHGGALSSGDPDTAPLEQALGHVFVQRNLLARALTHPGVTQSKGGRRPKHDGGYERLEFLGDRVLGLVVAEMLFKTFAAESEGDLARRHAQLVRKETLAEVAGDISLGRFIDLADSDTGNRNLPNLLADSCEAVIAALYLDGGLEAARRFIETYWQSRMQAERTPPKDAKTGLQEWALARGKPIPTYTLTATEGPPHQPVFTITVTLEAQSASGVGPSKRAAETAAAAVLLARLPGK